MINNTLPPPPTPPITNTCEHYVSHINEYNIDGQNGSFISKSGKFRFSHWKKVAIVRTIIFNFSMFPFLQAMRLPVRFSRKVRFVDCHRGTIEIEKGARLFFGITNTDTHIEHHSVITLRGKLVISGNGVHIFGSGTDLLIAHSATLKIGKNFATSPNNLIRVYSNIIVGDDNLWSWNNVVMDGDGHQVLDEFGKVINFNRPIYFGNKVWLGCNNLIMKGSSIPDGCIVASGSKISSEIKECNCIVGNNGKILKKNIRWNSARCISRDKGY